MGAGWGMGTGFLPLPQQVGGEGNWEVVVEWVLQREVPAGVRVASSLGDGVREVVAGRLERVLAKAYFAVWGGVAEVVGLGVCCWGRGGAAVLYVLDYGGAI
jgi:hypothetical protein